MFKHNLTFLLHPVSWPLWWKIFSSCPWLLLENYVLRKASCFSLTLMWLYWIWYGFRLPNFNKGFVGFPVLQFVHKISILCKRITFINNTMNYYMAHLLRNLILLCGHCMNDIISNQRSIRGGGVGEARLLEKKKDKKLRKERK